MLILLRKRSENNRRFNERFPDGRRANALITGASSGIGKETALYLAERGFNIIATSRRSSRLDELLAEAESRGVPMIGVELDINSEDTVAFMMPELIERHGTIDALVNNAGFGMWGPVQLLSDAELKSQFETNFFAAARMMRAVLPTMIAQRRGTIVNVSSVLGRMGTPFNGAYVSSKFALEGISESLKTEVQPFGVRVALVEPGLFRTDFPDNSVRGSAADGDSSYTPYIRQYGDNREMFHRFGGDPARVAEVIYKVITSPSPNFRNPVGIDARAGTLAARLLPERIYWRLLSKATMRE